MKWLGLAFLLLLSACSWDFSCVAPGNPQCGTRGPAVPPPDAAPFIGVWLNASPRLNELSRLELHQRDGQVYGRVFERCEAGDCPYLEREALTYWAQGGRSALELVTWREDMPKQVRLELTLVTAAEASARAVFSTETPTGELETDSKTHLFLKD